MLRPDMAIGNRFGVWTIIAFPDNAHPGRFYCRCDCGTER